MTETLMKQLRRLLLLAAALAAPALLSPSPAQAVSDHCDPIEPGGSDAQCVACDCQESGWFWLCDDGQRGEADCMH